MVSQAVEVPKRIPATPPVGFRIDLLPMVMGYENVDVIERLEKKLGLSESEAALLFTDTLRFLALSGLQDRSNRVPLVPPKTIDESWHHFLLFTEAYASFCSSRFGFFLHHQPSTSRTPLRGNGIITTIAMARAVFGDLSSNWSKNWSEEDAAGCEDCNCNTNCQVCYKN